MIRIKPPSDPQNEGPDEMPWCTVGALLVALVLIIAGIPVVEHRWGAEAAVNYQLVSMPVWLLTVAGIIAIRAGMGGRW